MPAEPVSPSRCSDILRRAQVEPLRRFPAGGAAPQLRSFPAPFDFHLRSGRSIASDHHRLAYLSCTACPAPTVRDQRTWAIPYAPLSVGSSSVVSGSAAGSASPGQSAIALSHRSAGSSRFAVLQSALGARPRRVASPRASPAAPPVSPPRAPCVQPRRAAEPRAWPAVLPLGPARALRRPQPSVLARLPFGRGAPLHQPPSVLARLPSGRGAPPRPPPSVPAPPPTAGGAHSLPRPFAPARPPSAGGAHSLPRPSALARLLFARGAPPLPPPCGLARLPSAPRGLAFPLLSAAFAVPAGLAAAAFEAPAASAVAVFADPCSAIGRRRPRAAGARSRQGGRPRQRQRGKEPGEMELAKTARQRARGRNKGGAFQMHIHA